MKGSIVRRFLAKLVLPVFLQPKSVFTTLVELGGFAAITYGVWRISPDAGWICAGAALVVVGVLAA